MKKLFFAGIDPGTTAGYAVVDTSGRLIKSRAAKELDIDSLVKELSSFGTVLVIGTDKAKTPSLVSLVATKLGARVSAPEEDVSVMEKRALTAGYKIATSHEADALASAILALKKHERLLARIEKFAQAEAPHLAGEIAEIVVKQGVNIRAGYEILQDSKDLLK
jgi:predicted RNase H-like nuclease (RuvC/YqgF family)